MRGWLRDLELLGELGAAMERQPPPPRAGEIVMREIAPGVFAAPASRPAARKLPPELEALRQTAGNVRDAFAGVRKQIRGRRCR